MLTNIENTTSFLSFSVFCLGAVLLCIFMLIIGSFLGPRSIGESKNIPFESGVNSIKNINMHFSVKFYLVAMLFVIFDVEALYLYTWSSVIRELGWIGFIESTIFIFILLINLIYLICIGALEWTSK